MTPVGTCERQGLEQAGHAMIGDGEILPLQAFCRSARASQLLPTPAGAGDQQIILGADPVSAGEIEEERAVEAAHDTVIDLQDAGGQARLGGAGAAIELLLLAQRRFLFEQERQPFSMVETGGLAHDAGLAIDDADPLAGTRRRLPHPRSTARWTWRPSVRSAGRRRTRACATSRRFSD